MFHSLPLHQSPTQRIVKMKRLNLIAATLIVLATSRSNQAFMDTDPLLAWSNAPGASLLEFPTPSILAQDPSIANSPDVHQMPLDSKLQPLCPTGSSSLFIFTLTSSVHQNNLRSGFLSSRINQEYNSISKSSRFWSNNFPISQVDHSILDLVSTWSSLCQGDVIVKPVPGDEEIDSVFQQTTDGIDGARLVIFTTPAMISLESSIETQTRPQYHERRQLLREDLLEDVPTSSDNTTRLPSPKAGLFWRYNFLSDYLIIGVLVMVLLFIPPVVLGCFALQSIESPKGLRTKMVGQVSEVKGN